jgi:hypothetical protein
MESVLIFIKAFQPGIVTPQKPRAIGIGSKANAVHVAGKVEASGRIEPIGPLSVLVSPLTPCFFIVLYESRFCEALFRDWIPVPVA